MDSLISRDTVTDLLRRLQTLGPLKEALQAGSGPRAERQGLIGMLGAVAELGGRLGALTLSQISLA